MNSHVQLAQAGQTSSDASQKKPIVKKVFKPQDGQAITVELGYDQQAKLDLTAVTNEKMTLVHVGENLIILFDNNSTVTVHPFFNSTGAPLQALSVEVAPGRDLPSGEFASVFPITPDPSVLAAGEQGVQQLASGANFSPVAVDELSLPTPLPLLGPEELPNFAITFETIPVHEQEQQQSEPPTHGDVTATDTDALVNEAGLPVIGSDAASNSEIFNGSITPSGGTGPYTLCADQPGDRQPRHAGAERRGRDLHLYADLAVRHHAGQHDNGGADRAGQGQLQLHGDRRPRQHRDRHDPGQHHRRRSDGACGQRQCERGRAADGCGVRRAGERRRRRGRLCGRRRGCRGSRGGRRPDDRCDDGRRYAPLRGCTARCI